MAVSLLIVGASSAIDTQLAKKAINVTSLLVIIHPMQYKSTVPMDPKPATASM